MRKRHEISETQPSRLSGPQTAKSITSAIPALGYGFRPFFFLAGLQPIYVMMIFIPFMIWPHWAEGGLSLVDWHAHELLFGFVLAAVTGFLLTAVPSWTRTRPVRGLPLALLIFIWLLGRAALFAPLGAPRELALAVILAAYAGLILAIAPALLRARKLRNLPFLLLLGLLALADFGFLASRGLGNWTPSFDPVALGVDLILVIITIIGGRIIPAFTRNALPEARSKKVGSAKALDLTAIALMVAFLLTDAIDLNRSATGGIAVAAALAQLVRLLLWRGWYAYDMPIVWILHLAYLWIPIGLAMKGTAILWQPEFASTWLHAFTAGAFATMILAVATRASLGHTGRPIVASRWIVASYGLVTIGAAVRVFGFALELPYLWAVAAAGLLWVSAFVIFTIVYAPILLRPRIDGRSG